MIRKRENNNSISNNRNDNVFKNKKNDDGNNESIKV